jgi:hypothetical protein
LGKAMQIAITDVSALGNVYSLNIVGTNVTDIDMLGDVIELFCSPNIPRNFPITTSRGLRRESLRRFEY